MVPSSYQDEYFNSSSKSSVYTSVLQTSINSSDGKLCEFDVIARNICRTNNEPRNLLIFVSRDQLEQQAQNQGFH